MLVVLLTTVLCIHAGHAAASDFYVGAGIGQFDADHDDTFINSATANVFVGYHINRYFSVELQAERVAHGSDTNNFAFRAEFSGRMLSPALLVRYPLAEDFAVFVRLGGSYMDYELANPELAELRQDTDIQPTFGAGFHSRFIFAEYVNYGELHGTELEQLRLGVKFSF